MFNRADKVIEKMNKKRKEKEEAEGDEDEQAGDRDIQIETVGDDSADEDEK